MLPEKSDFDLIPRMRARNSARQGDKMGDYSRYQGRQPGQETSTGELRRQTRLVQDETRQMLRKLNTQAAENRAYLMGEITALGDRLTVLEELADRVSALESAVENLDQRVTALENA